MKATAESLHTKKGCIGLLLDKRRCDTITMAQPPPLEIFLITLAQSQDEIILEGVDADKRPARLAVSGFRPHFYVGPVAEDVDATSRQADLCRAAPAHAVSVTKVRRTFLCLSLIHI